MSYRIRFIGIGHAKKTWESVAVIPPSDEVLEEEVRRSGALMSRDIAVSTAKEDGLAFVYAGLRQVGVIRWAAEP